MRTVYICIGKREGRSFELMALAEFGSLDGSII